MSCVSISLFFSVFCSFDFPPFLGEDKICLAKLDYFADLHYHSPASNLTLVGGLVERDERHPCGPDQFVHVGSLNNTRMTLAPRRIDVDPEVVRSSATNVNRVTLEHVVLQF